MYELVIVLLLVVLCILSFVYSGTKWLLLGFTCAYAAVVSYDAFTDKEYLKSYKRLPDKKCEWRTAGEFFVDNSDDKLFMQSFQTYLSWYRLRYNHEYMVVNSDIMVHFRSVLGEIYNLTIEDRYVDNSVESTVPILVWANDGKPSKSNVSEFIKLNREKGASDTSIWSKFKPPLIDAIGSALRTMNGDDDRVYSMSEILELLARQSIELKYPAEHTNINFNFDAPVLSAYDVANNTRTTLKSA